MEKFFSNLNPFKKDEPTFKGTGHRLGTADEDAARKKAQEEAMRAAQARAAGASSSSSASASRGTAATPAAQAALARTVPGTRAAAAPARAAPPPAVRPAPQAFVGTPHRLTDPSTPSPGAQKQQPAAQPPAPLLTGPAAEVATAPDGGRATAEVLYKLLDNLVREPGNEKFRRIRLTNPKIQAAVAEAPGGLAVLLSAGFHVALETLPEGGEDTFAVVPAAADAAALQAQAEKARAALQGLLPLLPPGFVQQQQQQLARAVSAEPVDLNWPLNAPPKAGRRERVFFPSQQTLEAIPDEFYTLSTEELVAEARKAKARLEAQATLTTRAYKERMEQERSGQQGPPQREATVRVRMPDGLLVQACFGVQEPVSSVYEWVASTLREPHRTFALNLPGVGDLTGALEKKLAAQRKAGGRAAAAAAAMTLADADLVRGGLLNLGWGQGEPPPAPGPSLREELACAAVALQ